MEKQVLAERVMIYSVPRNPRSGEYTDGHGYGEIVRESDPGGRAMEHVIVRSQRRIDVLFDDGVLAVKGDPIDPKGAIRHQAATQLRNDFERSSLFGSTAARDLGRPFGGNGESPLVGDEESWGRYRRAMVQCIQWWPIIRLVVIDDGDHLEYGRKMRCDGALMLQTALDKLVRHYGLIARRNK